MTFLRVREAQFMESKTSSLTTELRRQGDAQRCFSNCNAYVNHLRVLLNASHDSAGFAWDLRSHISNKLPDSMDFTGLGQIPAQVNHNSVV